MSSASSPSLPPLLDDLRAWSSGVLALALAGGFFGALRAPAGGVALHGSAVAANAAIAGGAALAVRTALRRSGVDDLSASAAAGALVGGAATRLV